MKSNYSFLKKVIPDGFIIGLILMILLAYFIPGIGMGMDYINLEVIIDYGISLIFFFYGLKLNPEDIRKGLGNWRLHSVIQSITFLLFPLIVLVLYPVIKGSSYEMLWLAVFFLAALPSTVSSSVVMVSIAEGNITGAIFNASISGIIGIFVTPLWMGIFLESQTDSFDFLDVLMQLILQIVIPVILGLLLQRFFGKWVSRYRKHLGLFDKTIILLIVYKSFSNSFTSGIFSTIGPVLLAFLFVSVILLFFLILFLSDKISGWMHFNREDSITVLFCGSKKSLVHGSVMANVLFAGVKGGGIFLLPIMIYHAFQLFYISIIARNKRMEYEEMMKRKV